MEKFGFLKKNLQDKGPNIAKEEKLKTLLEEKDTEVDEDTFKAGFEAAKDSKHATDKILAMMGLRSMISKKSEGKPIYITFPLSETDKSNIITKIKSSCEWEDNDVDDTIKKFIVSYNKLGKLAKAKISWVIAKMHNPKELATLAHDTKDRKKEVRAMLKFIQDNPIEEDMPYIKVAFSEDDAKPRIYTLNTECFKDTLKHYKISISKDFRDALDKYDDDGPKKGAFKRGLPAHGNEKIKAYNEALKKLMEEGTIDGKYPPEDSGSEGIDSKAVIEYAEHERKTEQNDYQFIESELNKCLEEGSYCATAATKIYDEFLSKFDKTASEEKIKQLIETIIENIKAQKYEDGINELRKNLKMLGMYIYQFIIDYIQNKQKPDKPLSTKWEKFCTYIPSINSSNNLKQARENTLKDDAFKALNVAFKPLGEALDETGETRETKLKEAKAAITGDIEVGSEKIAKSEIEKIFDEIVKILTPEKQWEEFCGYASNITNSNTLTWYINHYLIDKAFKDLDDAFELLGKALDETGAGKADKIKAAKATIPDEIKAGSETIEKSKIEAIFDEITREKTGGGLPFEIKGKPKSSVSTATSTATLEAMKPSESRAKSADNAQTEWQKGINPEKVRKGINPEAVQKGIKLGKARTGTTTGNSQK